MMRKVMCKKRGGRVLLTNTCPACELAPQHPNKAISLHRPDNKNKYPLGEWPLTDTDYDCVGVKLGENHKVK